MALEKGFPHSGSVWNRRISSGSLVCHSEPVGLGLSLTKGALKPTSSEPKIVLGARASGPVARECSCSMMVW